ncbi:MAG: NeuD/PglB/VioB family sugar acetyltransferase [Brevundimonas sp.]
MKRSLAIVGGGGHGRVVADCAEVLGWERIEFFDDKGAGTASGPWPVVGAVEALFDRLGDYDGVVVGIGANRARLDRHRALAGRGAAMATLIHPRATVSRHARIEAGTVVFAGAAVNFGAVIGQACIINTGATVDHDDHLADGVHLSPGAHLGGGATIGECSWIGLGASVREGVSIGRDVRIGAGAAVVAAAPDAVDLVGVPARPLKRSDDA